MIIVAAIRLGCSLLCGCNGFARNLFQALALGFRQHEYRHNEAENTGDSGRRFGAQQSFPVKQKGKGEDAEE